LSYSYVPTQEDWKRKGEEMRERTKARKVRKHYELVHRPIWGTLNGCFVREGEDFPLCDFLKPWVDSLTKRHFPGFEIFFDPQLQDSDEEGADSSIEAS